MASRSCKAARILPGRWFDARCRHGPLPPSAPALAALTAGCTLIDQTTFNPRAGLGPLPPPATGPGPVPALITINFETPNPDYQAQLRQRWTTRSPASGTSRSTS